MEKESDANAPDEGSVKPCVQDRLRSLIGSARTSPFKYLVIILLVGIFLYVSGRFIIDMNLVSDFKINLITELIGIGITFLLIERWIQMREETRRKPHKEALLAQIFSSYYTIVGRFNNIMRSLVAARVDNDTNWFIGRLVPIEKMYTDLNRIDNLAQDLLSFEERNDYLRINSVIELELSTLRQYEDSQFTDEYAIMELVQLTLLITEVVAYLERNIEQDPYHYPLDEIRVPVLSMQKARDYFNTTRDNIISSRELWAQKRQAASEP